MDNILGSIKKLLGIDEKYLEFDDEVKMNINSAFMALNQLGVGPADVYSITTGEEKWDEFVGSEIDLESVKIYVYYKTRLGFDPPNTGYILEAMERRMDELGWRLNVQVETREEVEL